MSEHLVIRFCNGRTALLSLKDVYNLAIEQQAFVEDPTDEDDLLMD